MSHLGFALKILALTIVLVLLMQIKISDTTIENHAHNFIKSSVVTEPIRGVADGGFALLRSGYQGAIHLFDSLVTSRFRSDAAPGKRKVTEVKRSSHYQKEQELREAKRPSEDSFDAYAE